MTVDNVYELYADGAYIGSDDDWTVESGFSLPARTKIIGVHAWDTGGGVSVKRITSTFTRFFLLQIANIGFGCDHRCTVSNSKKKNSKTFKYLDLNFVMVSFRLNLFRFCFQFGLIGSVSTGVVTDKSWKCILTGNTPHTTYPGWSTYGFDDSAWTVPVVSK